MANSDVAGLWVTKNQIYLSGIRGLESFAKLCEAARYSAVKEHLVPKSKFLL